MAKPTVLVTGAGGAAVPDLIRHLRVRGYRVVATDCNALAAGLCFADKGLCVPRGDAPEYLPELREVCRRERVQAVVPLVDEELLKAIELEADGIPVILPLREFVGMCLDKWTLMKALEAESIPVPRTMQPTDPDHNWPVIVKPRRGHGSKGARVCCSPEDYHDAQDSIAGNASGYIIQDYITGTEYTVSVVCWRDGRARAIVPKRIIDKRGITYRAVTERNKRIEALCEEIQAKLRADGPFNVQCIVDDSGEPYVIEINPRFSGTTNLTRAAGVDEVGGMLKLALGGEAAFFAPWLEGVTLVRHYADRTMIP